MGKDFDSARTLNDPRSQNSDYPEVANQGPIEPLHLRIRN